ncbi:hypothetical protein AOXY_G34116 [Acipenser oxyrinchus oxyrinchus]|uniref:Protein Smaug homolog 1 n=1 Tax=Acipenser oxyrinchus oxyrinchus TaxID=40147 RepID=A0AAD8CIS7_ACIOX|nr:hypothetical protein AOXY_G34116 [Acipenser oxyrinchus oxyrinchus]
MFRDQVRVLAGWFKGWNECEQTVALLSLLKQVSRTQARFLQLCLEHSLADCTELQVLELEANNPVLISQWQGEPKERVLSLVLTHLPLLQPGNVEAKGSTCSCFPRSWLTPSSTGATWRRAGSCYRDALIHPATPLEDRAALALWLNHLEERAAARADSLERPDPSPPLPSPPAPRLRRPAQRLAEHPRLGLWRGSWHQQGCENGTSPVPSISVPSTINALGTPSGANTILPGGHSGQHSPLKRSVSLTPDERQSGSPSDTAGCPRRTCAARPLPDHAPCPPEQCGVLGQRGSEHLDEGPHMSGTAHCTTFHEEGSGMRVSSPEREREDMAHYVPAWLKSLRLHKYAALFSTMTYDEMMSLTERQLESQNVTKGARHKIVISIQKLKERHMVLRSLEKDVLEGVVLRPSAGAAPDDPDAHQGLQRRGFGTAAPVKL